MKDVEGSPGVPDDALSDADLTNVPAHKWAPTLAEMYDANVAGFLHAGYDESLSVKLAGIGVRATAFQLGGRVVYIPRGDRLKLAVRDNEMYAAWQKHGDIQKLAEDFKVTEPTAYRIIAGQRKVRRANRMDVAKQS